MRVICDRDLLAPAFCYISRITKNEIYPLYSAILLTASAGQKPEQGTLTLVGLGMAGTVGLFTQLPATVQEEGTALVPIERLAEYIETLRSRALTLSQAQPTTSLTVEPIQDQIALSFAMPERAELLQVESEYTSDAGTTSKYKARFKAWVPTQYPLPPVQDWIKNPLFTCSLQASLFKNALTSCASFARSDAWRKGNANEMYGVLLQLHPNSVTLSATTGTMLISYCLPFEEPTSLSLAGLFEGKALFWMKMKDALPKKGMITLALTRDVQTRKLVLLLSTANATWFCRSMDVICPTHWQEILQQPHSAELLIRRGELKEPLEFFAKAAEVSEGVALATEGTDLRILLDANSDDMVHADRTLPLISSSTDVTVLVNPKQLKRLARLVSGMVLRLEIGRFVRQERQEEKVVGFLRASSERMQVMMSLSRKEKQSAHLPSAHKPEEPLPAQKHAVPVVTTPQA
jgi:hypothetical protein